MDDVFAVQDEIATDIIDALQVELAGGQTRTGTRHTDDIEAYHLYLRGRHVFFTRTPEAMAQSKLFFEQALAKDPRYSLALTGLADQYSINGFYGLTPSREAEARAREHATQALACDDSLSEAHNAIAFSSFYDHAWGEAARSARRAVQLNPANVIRPAVGCRDSRHRGTH